MSRTDGHRHKPNPVKVTRAKRLTRSLRQKARTEAQKAALADEPEDLDTLTPRHQEIVVAARCGHGCCY